MLLQMGATAQTEDAEVFCDEPDWNEGGLALLDIMEEYADDADFLAFLEDFMERTADELTGEMPEVVPYVVDVEEEVFFAPAVVQEIKTQWCDGNLEFNALSGIMPTSNAITVGDLRYEVAPNGTATVVGRATTNRVIVIPATVRIGNVDRTVRQISFSAFEASNITSVDIPATVTEIGAMAFGDCLNLTTVRFRGINTPDLLGMSVGLPGMPTFSFYVFTGTTNIQRIHVPLGAIATHLDNLPFKSGLSGVSLFGARNRIVGICANSNNINERCACCRFRIGHVTGNTANNNAITSTDALQITRYITGNMDNVIRPSGQDYRANSRNAALVTPVSRNSWTIRQRDAEDILRSLIGLCSWVNSGLSNNRPPCTGVCPNGHCHL
jgi:hypothetical protein